MWHSSQERRPFVSIFQSFLPTSRTGRRRPGFAMNGMNGTHSTPLVVLSTLTAIGVSVLDELLDLREAA
jgi:hypothetical protein